MRLSINKFCVTIFGSVKLILASGLIWMTACEALAGSNPATNPRLASQANLPMSFEENQGQFDAATRFVARGAAYYLSLSPTEACISLRKTDGAASTGSPAGRMVNASSSVSYRSVRVELLGANDQAPMCGVSELPGKVNYFIGNNPEKWRTSVPTYERVRVTDVYPGINLIHYGNAQRLEYDFEIAPGANPDDIAMRFIGADKMAISADGQLILTLGQEEIRQPKPVIYQIVRGIRTEISGGYVLADKRTVKFKVGKYDARVPLVIDPVVSYSAFQGYLGDDVLWAVAIDSEGNVFAAGETTSASLATPGVFQTNLAGVLAQHGDVLVQKIPNVTSSYDASYSTYLGGIAYESAFGLAVDGAGNAYVTGYTGSTNFPTRLAIQTNMAGTVTPGFTTPPLDVFIAKIGPLGTNLIFSTFYGGSKDDIGEGIALDASTNIYVTGYTLSTNLPTQNTSRTNSGGLEDAFVLKLDSSGTNLIYAMYLGGTNRDFALDVAVDATGNPVVTGYTSSTNFPITAGSAVQTNLNNTTNVSFAFDAFITRLQSSTGEVSYATFIGGNNNDFGFRLAADGAGSVYVTGSTSSPDFPQTATNFPSAVISNSLFADVFVTKLNSSGTNYGYSVVFGGSAKDEGWDIAVDGAGHAHVVGATDSVTFPTNAFFAPLRGTNSGGTDAFIAELNSNGSAFTYSAYIGSPASDLAYGVAVDAAGNTYVVGEANSSSFPTKPAFAGTFTDKDGFLLKILADPSMLSIALAGTNVAVSWPGFSSEFLLQSTTNIVVTNAWLDVSAPNTMTNGRTIVTIPATNASRFFRLKAP